MAPSGEAVWGDCPSLRGGRKSFSTRILRKFADIIIRAELQGVILTIFTGSGAGILYDALVMYGIIKYTILNVLIDRFTGG